MNVTPEMVISYSISLAVLTGWVRVGVVSLLQRRKAERERARVREQHIEVLEARVRHLETLLEEQAPPVTSQKGPRFSKSLSIAMTLRGPRVRETEPATPQSKPREHAWKPQGSGGWKCKHCQETTLYPNMPQDACFGEPRLSAEEQVGYEDVTADDQTVRRYRITYGGKTDDGLDIVSTHTPILMRRPGEDWEVLPS